MSNSEELKNIVTAKYTEVALNGGSCCSTECGCAEEVSFIGDDYEGLPGYTAEADLGLGCGLPTEHAQIKEGDVVVDLGSGAGNDCFIARSLVGPHGKVIGVDFTPAMIRKAVQNAEKLGYSNVEFILGDIDNNPLSENTADVVVSNCVMNLVPDKPQAFKETYRILKPGKHFSISDVVFKGHVPDQLKRSAELYAGCVSGALLIQDYLDAIEAAGFVKVSVQQQRKIDIPLEMLEQVLDHDQIQAYKNQAFGIYSVTVYGEKPEDCCDTNCCN
jgi:ubiquinone/menaquinone biosynthesis C-methylase UbiE